MKKYKIRSNQAVPHHSAEWEQGWKAFEDGKGKETNPYIGESEPLKYNRWLRGWEAAEYQNAKA